MSDTGRLNDDALQRGFRRWMKLFYGGVAVLALVFAIAWWLARPPQPDDFYSADVSAAAAPGTLLRAEPFYRNVPEGARGWRILYTTTGIDGETRLASGLVVAAEDRPAGPRPVVAWAHGTTGIRPGCAPSLLRNPFAYVPSFERVVDEGWVWVATDYTGLGTAGPHPYLVGPAEARAVLDAVRAARGIDAPALGARAVVWGHSQGGHAALWTGIIAPDYTPDIDLRGVAAVAPATDLPNLVAGVHDTFSGRMLSAYLVHAYAAVYPDIAVADQVRMLARPLAADIAGRCMAGAEILVSAVSSVLAVPSLFSDEPPTGEFARRLSENVPNRRIEAPVLIVQGADDSTVLPDVQGGFVARRCMAGQVIDYRGYAGQRHLSIVGEASPVPDSLMKWSRDRFDGAAAPTRCRVSRN
jgi:pimeloyl-ACP methyl ester carboxylesterase